MDLYTNLTSPYARVARIALKEKGVWDRVRQHVVDPWADAPDFVRANPLGRVPTLVTDEGDRLTECLLIVSYLDERVPNPALVPATGAGAVLGRAGRAMGIIDAAVAIIIGRKVAPDFDAGMVGRRRFRNMQVALSDLENDPPAMAGNAPDLSVIAAVVALDYLAFRFADTDWLEGRPRLAAMRAGLADRPSLVDTMPRM